MASYSYTEQQLREDLRRASLEHRATPRQLAEAGWQLQRAGSLPTRSCLGQRRPPGFFPGAAVPNCAVVFDLGGPLVRGVYRTPEQCRAMDEAAAALAKRAAGSREGRRAAARQAVKARALALGCYKRPTWDAISAS
jgi:hypothetical protein